MFRRFSVIGILASLSAFVLLHFNLCSAQEAPLIAPPRFDYNISLRNNVCDRQRQFHGGQLELRDALSGLDLSVSVIDFSQDPSLSYFFALDGNGVILKDNPGMIAAVLEELADRAGFRWRNSFYTEQPITKTSGGNWTELLEWTVKTFDVAANYWEESISRISLGVSYPEGWYDNNIIMIARSTRPKKKINLWSFLRPFERNVWISILVAVILQVSSTSSSRIWKKSLTQ